MRNPVMCLCGMLLAMGGLRHSVAAETSRERVAFSLSGPDCSVQRLSIVAALVQMRDVAHVDLESVPDHALIDILSGGMSRRKRSAQLRLGVYRPAHSATLRS